MRILVVRAGESGTRVLRQLRKNPKLTVLTLDPRERPRAVAEGVIEEVDFREQLTPLTLEYVVEEARPDLVLLTTASEDMDLPPAEGVDVLTRALREELVIIADVPVIQVARTGD